MANSTAARGNAPLNQGKECLGSDAEGESEVTPCSWEAGGTVRLRPSGKKYVGGGRGVVRNSKGWVPTGESMANREYD